MDELLADAAARAITYLRERDDRAVFPSDDDVRGLHGFVEALPEEGTDPRDVIRMLDEVGSPGTVASTGGRYFGFVTGGAQPVAVGASFLGAAWDQNSALGIMSPTVGVLDTIVGAWLTNLFGLPSGAQHHFVSGTSIANAMCLAAARDKLISDQGWDVPSDGLIGAPPLRVVVGAGAHSSVVKALRFVGLGQDAVITVPADEQGALVASELPEAGPPTLVILQAGNVNSGAFDPFDAVADHFEGTPTWTHVDGAFGLWAAASPAHRGLVAGIDRADSWATDMHKWLNVTYDSAIAVVKRPEDLLRSFHVGAAYLPDSVRLEPLHRGPAMSQRARPIETWAALKTLGRNGVVQLIDQCCAHAVRLADLLSEGGLRIHNDVVLNQVLVSLDDDEQTRTLVRAIQSEGSIWCGDSMWGERFVIRLSVSGWATTSDDIEHAAQTILGLAGTASANA